MKDSDWQYFLTNFHLCQKVAALSSSWKLAWATCNGFTFAMPSLAEEGLTASGLYLLSLIYAPSLPSPTSLSSLLQFPLCWEKRDNGRGD